MAGNVQSHSPSVSSCSFEIMDSSKNQSKPTASHDDLESILEYVLNDLHLSAKLSLLPFLESLVDEEVRKVVDSQHCGLTKEVFISCYTIYPPRSLSHILIFNVHLRFHKDHRTILLFFRSCQCIRSMQPLWK